MLRAQKDEVRNSIVFLEVSRSILKDRGVIFTDGNASNQQLSKYGSETAEIIPAATLHDVCRRYYHPDGPHGSNPNCSNFYANVAFLERLNWDAINSRSSRSDEKRRMKQAEVLIPDSLPLDRIQRILVSTPSMVQTVNKLIVAYRLKRYFSSAICETEMFL